ncbi:methyltransferase type 11 [Kribbella flavida DSM 17836]|uniref:Methyltransferase type 11 n=1 Tax=Kribbella flavida (strain DSM 17836 / JCM 10339 / NBRC 14399) TaxID=479435 RepID=D2PQ13_KRIFD|nr:hypothetical protein [Kribbella flavida]ADB32937.1 methyltransferase type 11 [Kribbella flavida DSM 17836]
MADDEGPAHADPRERARLQAVARAERAKLAELQIVDAAEELIADARFVDLLDQQVEAQRRHSTAEQQVTTALSTGDHGRITSARQRCRAAEVQSHRVRDEAIEEMLQLTSDGADRSTRYAAQYGRWQDAVAAELPPDVT